MLFSSVFADGQSRLTEAPWIGQSREQADATRAIVCQSLITKALDCGLEARVGSLSW